MDYQTILDTANAIKEKQSRNFLQRCAKYASFNCSRSQR